jgi:hypothetical protein
MVLKEKQKEKLVLQVGVGKERQKRGGRGWGSWMGREEWQRLQGKNETSQDIHQVPEVLKFNLLWLILLCRLWFLYLISGMEKKKAEFTHSYKYICEYYKHMDSFIRVNICIHKYAYVNIPLYK